MHQTANEVVAKAAIPRVKLEEMDTSLTGEVPTIEGKHKEYQEVKGKAYFHKERRYRAFSRSIQIPISIKSDKVKREYCQK